MILHIPHSSRELSDYVTLDNEQGNLDYLTDTDVDELFWYEYCDMIKFPLSRFVCDVERLKVNEPMEFKGQGIIYRKDCYGNDIIRHTSDEEIYKMYDDHHRKLTLAINRQLAYYENVVIVDCHSFSSDVDEDVDEDVDICVGTSDVHTPLKLVMIIVNHFHMEGLSVKINDPYSGTMVPEHHYGNCNVKSVMIEINKNVYINNYVYEFKPIITDLLEKINEYSWSIA